MNTEQTQAHMPPRLMNPFFKFGLLVLILGLILLVMGGPLYRFGFIELGLAFTLVRYSLYVNVLAASVCLIAGFLHARRYGWQRSIPAIFAVWAALALAYMPFNLYQQAQSVPPIHDITTDTQSPPQFQALAELRAEDENPVAYAGEEVARQQREAYPDIQPLYFDADINTMFVQAEAVARDMRWEVVSAVAAEGRIEAVASTSWFGFRDDVVVRIQSDADSGRTRLDIRSQSRIGVSDLGANAERIRRYRERLSGVIND